MKKYNRIFLIVTDSLGIGGDKRAAEFGDKNPNTFYNISKTNLLKIPTWKKLGIDSIAKLEGFNKSINQTAYMARMEELSNGKDTIIGHWEMMGIVTKKKFPIFVEKGFPDELINKFEKGFDGRKVIGNKAASGTVILDEMGHLEKNNKIIIYTSIDSNVQLCGNEETMGLENLYRYCEHVREICFSKPEWNVARIIARPYIVRDGKYIRTSNRHDYAVKPPQKTLLDFLKDDKVNTVSVGKINDIFSGEGISEKYKGNSDDENMDITIDLAQKNSKREFIFVNLSDFDTKYGHRRNPEGYAENINRFDIKLSKLMNAIKDDDLLLITSDHGNDPTHSGSDHTREHVPVTIYAKNFEQKPKKIDNFIGFATIGNLIAYNFDVKFLENGQKRHKEIV